MVDAEKARVWAVRLAAPIVFFAAATVLIVLVQQGLSAGESEASPVTTAPVTTSAETGTATAPTTTGQQVRRYRVRAGDTLESIALRFETTVADLLELNPGIDPLALSPGQRIRVPDTGTA